MLSTTLMVMICLACILLVVYFSTKNLRKNHTNDEVIIENEIAWSQNPTLPSKIKKVRKKILKKPRKIKQKKITRPVNKKHIASDDVINDHPIFYPAKSNDDSDIRKKEDVAIDRSSRPFWEG